MAVTVVFGALARPAAAQAAFDDVPEDAYFAVPVADLHASGVFDGTLCASGRFCPSEPLPRWVMAVWLVRILDGEDPPAGGSRFTDITGSPWWEAHVERLAELGVTVGCRTEPREFCPDSHVSRAQMATFLHRAFRLPPAPAPGFDDVEPDGTHFAAINALARSGITVGCRTEPLLRFCPDRSTTRGQMATFLHRALETTRSARVVPVAVFYCGPAGVYDDARLQAEVDLLQEHVDGFYRRQSGYDTSGGRSRGTRIDFSAGGVLPASILPSGLEWESQTLSDWHHKAKNRLWEPDGSDPCSTEAAAIAGTSAVLVLANMDDGTAHRLGYAVLGRGPAVALTVENQPAAGDRQRQWFYYTVAHEIGHAFYGWEHPWEDQEEPTQEQLQSVMSHEDRGAGLNLAPGQPDSAHIACYQLQQYGWVEPDAGGGCPAPGAAPRHARPSGAEAR